jgi:hypothetical protein
MNPSVKQALHFFTLVDQRGTSEERLQALYQNGLLSDLLDPDANVDEINRDEYRKVLGLSPVTMVFQTWKTIVLGRRKTAEDYRKSIKAHRRVDNYANHLLGKTSIAEIEVEVDLVRASVKDLGFKKKIRLNAIIARALSYGLEKCVAEVGPALADQYSDQPKGEYLAIAMDAITGLGGYPSIFGVRRVDCGPWLGTCDRYPASVYDPDDVFVFVRPRKQAVA